MFHLLFFGEPLFIFLAQGNGKLKNIELYINQCIQLIVFVYPSVNPYSMPLCLMETQKDVLAITDGLSIIVM